MADKQRTIAQVVTLTGKGLHTGAEVEVSIQPAEVNTGIIFQRTDMDGQPKIEAVAENVIDTSRGTTIAVKNAKVITIEHMMAALYGMGIDNALVQVNGPEMPIMDGSSKYFVEAIAKVGTVEQGAERNYLYIKDKMVYTDEKNNVEIIIYPDDKLSIDVMVDYNSRVLGHQYAKMNSIDDFPEQISPCRTFVFFHELEVLLKHNLIKGGDLENAIVVMEHKVPQEELDRIADLFNKPHIAVKPEGILNNLDLHFDNEPARHKLLDMVGDFALVGARIKGKIIAMRPGHKANTEFAKILRKHYKQERLKPVAPEYDPNKPPLLDVNQIMKILPHRHPFLLIDKILYLDGTTVVGMKNVTMNEAFFVGHFPDEPVMPGVLQVEAMAQTGGILVLNTVPDPENYLTYFLKIDQVRFKRKVVPGDTILFKCFLNEPIRRGIANMTGQAFVGDQLVMEGILMAQITKVKE